MPSYLKWRVQLLLGPRARLNACLLRVRAMLPAAEVVGPRGRQLAGKEAQKLELGAGRPLRPHDELREHLRRMEARPRRPGDHGTLPLSARAAPPRAALAMGGDAVAAAEDNASSRRSATAPPRSHGKGHGMLTGTASPPLGRWRSGPLLASLPLLRRREPLRGCHGTTTRR